MGIAGSIIKHIALMNAVDSMCRNVWNLSHDYLRVKWVRLAALQWNLLF